ncbi:hypothetical protein [Goodfellowiella coeruleoviolacea]|uniref:hypothetical protein n=1 Tax=Goodfellowiella coeruleoviolacea TaxID=334858 RepID=UPI0020A55177|nr:hypothetical protein [Goodfellowiella coeruleoviolacea]
MDVDVDADADGDTENARESTAVPMAARTLRFFTLLTRFSCGAVLVKQVQTLVPPFGTGPEPVPVNAARSGVRSTDGVLADAGVPTSACSPARAHQRVPSRASEKNIDIAVICGILIHQEQEYARATGMIRPHG